ncbi:MAG: membrane protein insertase YidC [Acetobacteraceae bacterium]
MDQKRLFLAISLSLAIMIGFQMLIAPHLAKPPPPGPPLSEQTAERTSPATPATGSPGTGAATATATAPSSVVPKEVPRVQINAPSVRGSISLLGARIDDLVLLDYRETLDPTSPYVRLLEPRSEPQPYYVQYGWTAPQGSQIKLPDSDTLWSASGTSLGPDSPVTLSWNNGAGLTFLIELSIDANYMFDVRQTVQNATGEEVKLFPWARVRRDYKPHVLGYYILFEGLLGVVDGKLHEVTYDAAKSDAEKKQGIAYEAAATGGWIGITDKYWLTALIPDQSMPTRVYFRQTSENGEHYQVDYVTQDARSVAPGGEMSVASHLFAGAKLVHLLDRYQEQYHIPSFDKAVDFGWFYFLTKPIFFALDYLYRLLGNFGVAILVFTVIVKAAFFPLANYSYRSMSKMKLLAPKMTALRERYKDDPQRMQQEMMAMYRAEKVNPASGCLPILVQIPVFFALYKVLFVTIEMRQAPFFGWIRDLSQVDPTNVFNLFGLLPFDPTVVPVFGHFLHLGAWPLIMGVTMFLQQKLNPPPPDPVQAKLFQFMPIIFTFMLAGFPAGLVIYWSWNNLLSIGQQWLIMRQTQLGSPAQSKA